ncbi:DNA polymerase IV [Lujinxingia litoralis]|uniref:DNA polymerase IV n=1 Tax=Lujinxingia litoralis TaxID=2211119 RepID=A0A328C999_9DELT|nr:DNA polymerase IV [Lujinxingia litoralis]RAL21530.1 DNA polymerase IV [Lujinxingia litoralis]
MRKIIHVDMDCFFAAIEMRDDPILRGRPIAVGGDPGRRGVIATANYQARTFGVRSAMASAYAVRLCPQLIILPSRMNVYREESQKIRAIFERYTEIIEPLSLDEAFLDLTHSEHHRGSATLSARAIREAIFKETGLTASAGISINKFLAKVASEIEKPDGQYVVAPHQVAGFMRELPVKAIPGVGKVTARSIHDMGVKTCGDLQRVELSELVRRFGKRGKRLYELARGIDERPVRTERIARSVSVETTYASDLPDLNACTARLPALVESLHRRLGRKERPPIRALFVKVKFEDFHQTTVERAELTEPTVKAYARLLAEALQRSEQAVRLLGVGVRLDHEHDLLPQQLELFF